MIYFVFNFIGLKNYTESQKSTTIIPHNQNNTIFNISSITRHGVTISYIPATKQTESQEVSVIPHRYSGHIGAAVSLIGDIDSPGTSSSNFTALCVTSVTHIVMPNLRFTQI